MKYIVESKDISKRLDIFLSENIKDATRSYIKNLIDDKKIRVNSNFVKAGYKLKENDVIDLQTAIEDNMLLNIPTTILTPEEKEKDIYPEGKGWEVVSESAFEEGKKNQVNPAFAKLKVLFDNNENNKKK